MQMLIYKTLTGYIIYFSFIETIKATTSRGKIYIVLHVYMSYFNFFILVVFVYNKNWKMNTFDNNVMKLGGYFKDYDI